ncbi:MAG: aminotransferase class III-fold pyridoxal phosphate-dependent enzyme [Ardenticatenaceae bacterium]|nr:aminotransferase class III-fold pyridoxal phosphate-dependent enzyme [Ardenticatenaceae bacterium]HBY92997.1 aspartate aminotransferase family protein [Chloroflexota bacterium]
MTSTSSSTFEVTPELFSPVLYRMTPLAVERGEGCYLWDVNGRRYLDFTSGIGVTNTGHCHPRVVAAAQAQVARLIHGQQNIVWHEPLMRLARELLPVMPGDIDTFFFSNSGAEAVEASIKLARAATGRPNIIAFERSFHGRTIGTMSLTSSKTVYRAGYEPLMAGVFFAPYAYCFRCPVAVRSEGRYGFDHCCLYPLEKLEWMLHAETAPEETAAMIIEPVLGEGGYVVPPVEFMRGLREICDRHGILLIVDEVQSGIGRTGKFWAVEHFGIVPDIVVMAKGLASGFPLSGIAASRELMAGWAPATHGGTYGGNAVACAAAVATVQLMKEGLVAHAAEMGEHLITRLRDLQADFPTMADVRGLGLMVGTEFMRDGVPAGDIVKNLVADSLDHGLMLLTCGSDNNVVRWIPPLVVTREQLDEAVEIFAGALDRHTG